MSQPPPPKKVDLVSVPLLQAKSRPAAPSSTKRFVPPKPTKPLVDKKPDPSNVIVIEDEEEDDDRMDMDDETSYWTVN